MLREMGHANLIERMQQFPMRSVETLFNAGLKGFMETRLPFILPNQDNRLINARQMSAIASQFNQINGDSLEEILAKCLKVILNLNFHWMPEHMGGVIFLVEGEVLRLAAYGQVSDNVKTNCAIVQKGECICGEAWEKGESLFYPLCPKVIEYEDSLDKNWLPRIKSHGHYSVSILFQNQSLGVLTLYVKEGQEIIDDIIAFLEDVGLKIGSMIQHYRDIEAYKKQQEELISFTIELSHANGEIQKANKEIQEKEDNLIKAMIDLSQANEELKKKEAILEKLAFTDVLTGLPNRAFFNTIAEQYVYTAVRNKSSLALLLIDLDRFKFVNDNYGHSVGDTLLKKVAQRLSGECVRLSDLKGSSTTAQKDGSVIRQGGDEFSVLLCGCSMEGAIIVAERIIERLKMPFPIAGHICQIGASIGIAMFNNTEDVASLVNRADQAMYTAKEAGKNCYRIATFQEYE